MSSQSVNPPESPKDSNSEKTVKIEIVRHQRIFNLLENPIKLRRLFLFLVALLIVVIVGLSGVLLTLKAFYPYNTITTTLNGATIIESEDGVVTYWLFNTAELWANSGIEVKKGDVLTIRASGASHTAIHHLAKQAQENTKLSDTWAGTEGRKYPSPDLRNQLRNKFRIAPNEDEGVLLMQVIPADSSKRGAIKRSSEIYDFIDGSNSKSAGRIYIIGKERQNLVIRQDGTLHFSVNDVVLTDSIIQRMFDANIKLMADSGCKEIRQYTFENLYPGYQKYDRTEQRPSVLKMDRISKGNLAKFNFNPDSADSLSGVWNKSFKLATHPGFNSGNSTTPANLLVNELLYYYEKDFHDAWFVDNLGSFLIIIERKKAK